MKFNFGFYSISLAALVAIGLGSFAMPQLELNLRRLSLKDNVQFSIGALNQKANFSKLGEVDGLKVDADLAAFKVERISDAFISADGKYIITFVKDVDSKMKRVIFYFHNGQTVASADDVIDVASDLIKTSQGTTQIGDVSPTE